MAHVQTPDLVFQWNRRVRLNRRGCQFSRLLAVEECGSADSDCIDRVPTYSARLLATHSIRIFPLHFLSCASPCAIRFWTRYTYSKSQNVKHFAVDTTQHWQFWCLQSLLCNYFDECTTYAIYIYIYIYTGSPRRNVPDFGRVFLMLNYTDITQNTYTQSWMVWEIMAREVWNFDSCYSLIDYQIHIETGRSMWFL